MHGSADVPLFLHQSTDGGSRAFRETACRMAVRRMARRRQQSAIPSLKQDMQFQGARRGDLWSPNLNNPALRAAEHWFSDWEVAAPGDAPSLIREFLLEIHAQANASPQRPGTRPVPTCGGCRLIVANRFLCQEAAFGRGVRGRCWRRVRLAFPD